MTVWFISDTHYGHEHVYAKFKKEDGCTPLRPWNSSEEADAAMVERWNAAVHPKDKVYHLGDVAIPRSGLKILEQLNGRKVLVAGNHDTFKLENYTPYFEDIKGAHKYKNFIISHIPLHPESVPHWARANIHGHLHSRRVQKEVGALWWKKNVEDKRYFNVSVEQINFTPISFEEIKSRFN
jgi:calcineurin-like phosphoesterase family protein